MTDENGRVGRVIGTKSSQPLEFWLAVEDPGYVQLDEVVAVTTQLPTALADGRVDVDHYGVVDAVESSYEGASFHSDTFRHAEGTLPVDVSTIAHVSVTRVAVKSTEIKRAGSRSPGAAASRPERASRRCLRPPDGAVLRQDGARLPRRPLPRWPTGLREFGVSGW